ncbi:hypothetical protein [Arthrobacter rhombi]
MIPLFWVIIGGLILGGSVAIGATAAVLAVIGAFKAPTAIIRAIKGKK